MDKLAITASSARYIADSFPAFRDIMDDIYDKVRDNAHYGSKKMVYKLNRPIDNEVFHKISGELHEKGYGVGNIVMPDGAFVEYFTIYYLKTG